MKPYPLRNLLLRHRFFNHRLSRGRRIVENGFGILAKRMRDFLSPIQLSPESVIKIILAGCALHNFLRKKLLQRYTPSGSFDREDLESGKIIPRDWRTSGTEMQSVSVSSSNNYIRSAKEVRETFCEYFNTVGKVSWQEKFKTLHLNTGTSKGVLLQFACLGIFYIKSILTRFECVFRGFIESLRNKSGLKNSHFDSYTSSAPAPLFAYFVSAYSLEKYERNVLIFDFTASTKKRLLCVL